MSGTQAYHPLVLHYRRARNQALPFSGYGALTMVHEYRSIRIGIGGTEIQAGRQGVEHSMARVGNAGLKAFSEAIQELYRPGTQEDLPVRFFEILRRCIPFDFLAYHEITNNYHNDRIVVYPQYDRDVKALEAYLHQHPTWNGVVKNRIEGPVKVSDFVTLTQWQRTDLYNHIFRPRDQNHQIAFIALDNRPQLGVALNRSTPDFSEEDRELLGLLKPHLVQAFNTSRLVSYFAETLDAVDQGYLVADNNGKIRFGTKKAIHLLERYFGSGPAASIPEQLQDWLKRRAASVSDANGVTPPLNSFSVQVGSKRLTVEILSPLRTREYRLILQETIERLDPAPLQVLGLTKREAEVLLWISQGKRNAEIGQILGISLLTVKKHAERIISKLCVENRTAACTAALSVLKA